MGIFNFLKPKTDFPPDVAEVMKKMSKIAFPRGDKQIEEETDHLYSLLRGTLSKDDSRSLLIRAKGLFLISKDKSESQMIPKIIHTSNTRLSLHEAHLVYGFLTAVLGPLKMHNSNSSAEQVVVINASTTMDGISQEYSHIERLCGKQGEDYTLIRQMMLDQNGRHYDLLTVRMRNGAIRDFLFDITSFFGKL